MSVDDLIPPGTYSFPESITLDLHDIITVLLRERLLSDERFRKAKLLEICDGAWPPSCVPQELHRKFMDIESPKVGYFLKMLKDEDAADANAIVEPHNFLHDALITRRDLDIEEVETTFWRIKNFDSGFLLHHALQLVLDCLPKSATLRVRTSNGQVLSCGPQSFAVAEMGLLPKMLVFINAIHPHEIIDGTKQVSIDQHIFGKKWRAEPWVYLIFGKEGDLTQDRDSDKCVAVDLNSSVIGLRGLGGEPFVMESRSTYHNKMLPRVAEEDLGLIQFPRISAVNHEKALPAVELAKRVLERIARGAGTFCAYCGKAYPKVQCSRCRGKSKYCGVSCQKKAWPYHKVWCRIDAAKPNANADVQMKY